MKIKILWFTLFGFLSLCEVYAQEPQTLTLQQAVDMALTQSDAVKISETKTNTAANELQVTKNNQYPDVKVSGQYMHLTNAKIDLKIPLNNNNNSDGTTTDPAPAPNVNRLLLGQANASMPIFSGFKLKNAIKAGENSYQAAVLNAKNEKEQIALQTIRDYLNLYKANKAIALIEENLKSARQRVSDFSSMEQNGLLARNDLLKAQLQQSNIRLSLEEARKNKNILSYKLATLLKLPEGTEINTTDTNLGETPAALPQKNISRNDLEALKYQEKAAENQVKVAQSNYYPSLALVGGYTALDLHNALTVTNAINIGVGVSYNLANIFKTKSDVKVAESRTNELKYTIDMVSDKVKVQVENAQQDYELALKKYDVYQQSQEQAVENYRIVKDKYDNGLMDTKDLLEADVQQLQAKMDLAYAKADISQKYYELLTAQGTLTNQFNK